ncbi:MAG: hypothetical protein HZC24_08730 [Rhodocyclales bacterium]|nr:hypothetical protein [Rhodocyclales bacterium]
MHAVDEPDHQHEDHGQHQAQGEPAFGAPQAVAEVAQIAEVLVRLVPQPLPQPLAVHA